jgi:hypothetical protein
MATYRVVQESHHAREAQACDDERYHDEPRCLPGATRVAEIEGTGEGEEGTGDELARLELMPQHGPPPPVPHRPPGRR